jgi:hypothetical protein
MCWKMKPELTRRVIGGAAALIGLWWTCAVIFIPVSRLWLEDVGPSDVLFLLTVVPMMAIPGILALIFGIRLFRKMCEVSLNGVVGLVAVFVVFCLSSRLSPVFPTILPKRLLETTLLFVFSLAVIPGYFFVVRFLIKHFTNRAPRGVASLRRAALILMSLQLWQLLTAYFDQYSPIKEGYTHVPEEPWGLLGAFVPIALACGSYRIVSGKLNRTQQDAE